MLHDQCPNENGQETLSSSTPPDSIETSMTSSAGSLKPFSFCDLFSEIIPWSFSTTGTSGVSKVEDTVIQTDVTQAEQLTSSPEKLWVKNENDLDFSNMPAQIEVSIDTNGQIVPLAQANSYEPYNYRSIGEAPSSFSESFSDGEQSTPTSTSQFLAPPFENLNGNIMLARVIGKLLHDLFSWTYKTTSTSLLPEVMSPQPASLQSQNQMCQQMGLAPHSKNTSSVPTPSIAGFFAHPLNADLVNSGKEITPFATPSVGNTLEKN